VSQKKIQCFPFFTLKIELTRSPCQLFRCRAYEGDGVNVVFAYGSLIFKPPPHTIGKTVGYVKGYARRFAQSSNDHRGTARQPGRVVTLVCASQWHSFISNDDTPEGDIVWGVAWTIDPTKSKEVRAYLDDREKNGYTPQSVEVYQKDKQGKETVAIQNALLYVGLPDNEAFVGPATSLKDLAEYIFTCEGARYVVI
jgi:cation transport protein ChaC